MLAKKKKMPHKVTPNPQENPNDDEEAFVKSMGNLRNTDPEFYEFLKENDRKLLDFNIDSDASDNEQEEQDDDDDDNKIHKPSDELHGDSDDDDFESSETVSSNKLTLKMIGEWQRGLQSEGKISVATISSVVQAFHGALLRVSSAENDQSNMLKVEGSGVFNAVIQMCVLYLQPAIKKVLGMKATEKNPQKYKRWVKVRGLLKTYFIDLFKLLGNVTSTNILTVLLKHLHQMSVFMACFPALTKPLFKRLVFLWSTSEDTVRVLAFLCILRVTRNNQPLLLNNTLKMMYMAYVKNSKFVSPGTMPGISFMRRSLIEMFALDLSASYQHVFLYIRQLAIHLRNAIVLNKKENIQVVYNWQFLNSVQLWAELLSATKSKPQLQSLTYPLVMILTNAIKLIPTAQYYPLRFHCIQILINLSKDSEIFIPILPFILEVLNSYDFSKKHKKVSMKPLNFSCVLRLSKSHLVENGFKDAIIENVYALLLETLCLYSHCISFPDIVIMATMQLRNFLKKCPVSNYNRKIRLIVDKIEENAQFVESERKKVDFRLSDTKLIKAWETNIRNGGTPLQTYYDTWKKLNVQQKKKNLTKNHELAEKLPSITKKATKRRKSEGPVELFPSDSEEDDDVFEDDEPVEDDDVKPPKEKSKTKKRKLDKYNEDAPVIKTKKAKKPKKSKERRQNEADEIADDEVNDFDLNDW